MKFVYWFGRPYTVEVAPLQYREKWPEIEFLPWELQKTKFKAVWSYRTTLDNLKAQKISFHHILMPAHYTSVLLKCWLCGFRTPPVLSIVIRWLIWVIRHIQGYHHKEETYASNIYKFQPQRTPVRGAIGYVKHPKKSHCYSHPVRTTWVCNNNNNIIIIYNNN